MHFATTLAALLSASAATTLASPVYMGGSNTNNNNNAAPNTPPAWPAVTPGAGSGLTNTTTAAASGTQFCAGKPYAPGRYTCFNNTALCPVLSSGTATQPCGDACYDPKLYGCVGGATLVQLTNATAPGGVFPPAGVRPTGVPATPAATPLATPGGWY